jgi:hypothetical protein
MSPSWSAWLVAVALFSSVVYGVDVFFALIARPALRRVDEASLTQVLGHLHAVADARMPLFDATALLTTGGSFLRWAAGQRYPAASPYWPWPWPGR